MGFNVATLLSKRACNKCLRIGNKAASMLREFFMTVPVILPRFIVV